VRLVTRLTVGLRGFTLSLHLRACLVCKYICNFLFIYFFVSLRKKKEKKKKTKKTTIKQETFSLVIGTEIEGEG
jgi:hypothetical protein